MRYIRLGQTGLKVSRLCLGMMSYGDQRWRDWVLDEAAAEPIVRRAADAGVTFVDTADVYSHGASEEITGRLLRKIFPRREEFVLATKVCSPTGPGQNDRGLSRKHILAAIDASLQRLGTDYVDLYQIHRWDYDTPIEETVEALHDVVHAGKARYIGASSMFAWQFAKAQNVAERQGGARFASMQDHYNLLYREEEREMIPLCLDQGVGTVPWSPLARGLLARPRTSDQSTLRRRSDFLIDRFYEDSDSKILDHLDETARNHGIPPAQVALAWLLHKPAVTAPIIGATTERHVDDAVAAVDVDLSDEEIGLLEEPYRPQPIRGHT